MTVHPSIIINKCNNSHNPQVVTRKTWTTLRDSSNSSSRWSSDPDPDKPLEDGWTDRFMDAKAGVEQVEASALSVNLSEWCLLQVTPEKCNRKTLSRQQTAGREVNLISNYKILHSEKPWIWLCHITDVLSHGLHRKPSYTRIMRRRKTAESPCMW